MIKRIIKISCFVLILAFVVYLTREYWLIIPANNDNVQAQRELVKIYKKAKNTERLGYWSDRLAKNGHPEALIELGNYYMYDCKDPEWGLYWYVKAAETGYVGAQLNLAEVYLNGYGGCDKDSVQAFKWMMAAAERGDTIGQNGVGHYYINGIGVRKNYKKGIYWLKKAIKQNSANAKMNLGVCYINGYGVEKDYKKALYWYMEAAKQGHSGG